MILDILLIIFIIAVLQTPILYLLFQDRKEKREIMKYLSAFKITKKDLKNASKIKDAISKDIAENILINENPIKIDGFPLTSKTLNTDPSMISSLFGNSGFLTSFALKQIGISEESPVNQFLTNTAIIETIASKFVNSIFSGTKQLKDSNNKDDKKKKGEKTLFSEWACL